MLNNLSQKQKSVILIAIFCFIIYFNTIFNDFVTDDYGNIVNNEKIKNITKLPEIFSSPFWTFSEGSLGYYTPLTSLSFAIDYAIYGLNPGGFHFANIIIHTINAILVFLIVSKLVRNKKIPLISALLFATFPISVDSVAWISGRTHMLALMFSLVSFWCFIRYRETLRNRFYLVSLISFALALLSKETALFLPVLIMVYDYLYHKKTLGAFVKGLKRNSVFYGGFFSILAAYALITLAIVGNVLPETINSFNYPTNPLFGKGFLLALVNTPLIFFYYSLMVLTNIIFDFPPFLIESAFNPLWILSFFLLLIPVFYFIKLRKKYAFVTFFLFWFMINLLPAIIALPLYTTYVVNRFSYIPSIGLAVLLPAGVLYISKKRKLNPSFFAAFFIFIIIVFSGIAFAKTFEWRNEVTLMESIIRSNPKNYFAYNYLGNYYLERNKLGEATVYFEKALEIEPNYTLTLNNLGNIYFMRGDYYKAAGFFEKALEIEPDSVETINNLANSYVMTERYDDAISLYKKAISINPQSIDSHKNLATLYYLLMMYGNSTEEYKAVLSLQPDNIDAMNGLAFNYLYMNLYQEAINEFEKIIQINPNHADAYFNIGVTYLNVFDDREKAEYYIRKALEIDPNVQEYQDALNMISGTN